MFLKTQTKSKYTPAECHPLRALWAKGMCYKCYSKEYYLREQGIPKSFCRRQLADELTLLLGISTKKAQEILRTIFGSILQAIERKEEVDIAEFGKFKLLRPDRYSFVRFYPSPSLLKDLNDH